MNAKVQQDESYHSSGDIVELVDETIDAMRVLISLRRCLV